MTFTIRFTAFVCLSLGTFTSAQAAVPKVSGTYATMSWHICQTVVVTQRNTLSRVTAPITVPGIGGITTSTNSFVSALTPASDNFLKDINGTTGQAIVNLGPTMNSAIADVQPTSTVNFVTVVNHTDQLAVTTVENNLNAGTANGAAGMMSMSVGTVTFPATAASSGTATSSLSEILGHAIRVPGDSSAIGRHVNGAQQATFSFTQTSAMIGGKTYDMSFGNVQAGVARTINLIRRPGANEYCIDGQTLTKQ